MLQRRRLRARLLAINAAALLSSRLPHATSTTPSVALRSYHVVHSVPKSTNDSIASRSKSVAGKEEFSSTVSNDSVSLHPTAIVDKEAIIGRVNVYTEVVAWQCSLSGSGAIVGADIPGSTIIGKENSIGHYAVVGVKCQDLKYKEGDNCHLHIGNKNDIREYVSIHRSSRSNEQTIVGNGNLIMGGCHIAHDCKVGNGNILANGTLLGGHVVLQDHVHTGGGVAVHQRCQIDSYAFVAGGSMVVRDVPMYMMVSGDRAELCGLNLEGLRRHKFCDNELRMIKKVYQKLFMNTDGKLESRLAILESIEEMMSMPAIVHMLSSVRNCFAENRRGICNFGRWKCE